ncbi:Cys-tRNA(Pro) deacylase, prolyl-tRNA editing enzyme YbaK/EbsC [Raineyella antarctica]|uniref:Cys-tRNA(Pro) deacylase, prolyl-tRNA editing enzyme YbaK/EbsC n=1 Tax=Raineyella antarctica TaxID=1577474 RepID=A0A1G6GHS0_9ACTN|nr:YbaK/EbsC family protein [Raineyella antarctica]SDB81393.1 Cys-tRNA(Pro) deacylase, prolyl-tRNA editing enzyme YbaK/EbsC [Raineyella antarctica]
MTTAEGNLTWTPASTPEATALLAGATASVITDYPSAKVAPIDAALADTAAFCEAYDSPPSHSANCVVVAGKRAGAVTYAAVLVLASDRADINGVVRRHLGVRKISFAPQEEAVELTGMEFGGITPIGLPTEWPLLIDAAVMDRDQVVIGSGIRGSKIVVAPGDLAARNGALVLELTKAE